MRFVPLLEPSVLTTRRKRFPPIEVEKPQAAKHRRLLADRLASRVEIESLTKSAKVHVRPQLPPLWILTEEELAAQIHIEQLSIFVLRCGTIISFSQDPGFHGRISEVLDRIDWPDSLIRDSEDVSFVLQALLDVVADHALDIVDEVRPSSTLPDHANAPLLAAVPGRVDFPRSASFGAAGHE